MRELVMPQLDAHEYLRWEARRPTKFELHHGFAVAFAAGSIDHDRIAFNVRTALERLFPAPCWSFGADVKVRVAAAGFFYVDGGIVYGTVDRRAGFVDARVRYRRKARCVSRTAESRVVSHRARRHAPRRGRLARRRRRLVHDRRR
jgi:hypothetical protein